jgi:hypothetical protein
MPQCSYCGCDLPALTDICRKCFDARYAEIDRPKSLMEIVTNPTGLTAEELRQVREAPLPLGRKILTFLYAFALFVLYGLFHDHFGYHPYPLGPKTCALIALPLALIIVYVESRSRR